MHIQTAEREPLQYTWQKSDLLIDDQVRGVVEIARSRHSICVFAALWEAINSNEPFPQGVAEIYCGVVNIYPRGSYVAVSSYTKEKECAFSNWREAVNWLVTIRLNNLWNASAWQYND